jgi:hypothetical protein
MLNETELKIGGTKLKGVWIAIVLTIGTSIGGTVWTASSLYSRLEAVETRPIPDTTEMQEQLVALGSNLETIMERQKELIALQERVVEVEKLVTEMQVTVEKAELATENSGKIQDRLDKTDKEIESLWQGMDFLANPYRGE